MRIGLKCFLIQAPIISVITALLALDGNLFAIEPVQSDDCACAETYSACGDCCDSGCAGGHFGGCAGSCSMPPHYMYYPQSHGNYYFRPYNYQTILNQQQSVGRYGGDPRNPYDNRLFLPLYEAAKRGGVQEEIAIPDPMSAAKAARGREAMPVSILRDDPARPPKVHVAPATEDVARAKSNNSAYRVRLVPEIE